MISRKLTGVFILAVALSFVLSSCGVKAPPLPAASLLPKTVSSPVFFFDETGLLEVTFRPPTKNKLDLPLKNLGGFYVERSENRMRADFCPGCPVRYTERFDITAQPPPPDRTVADVEYRFEDHLQPGFIYYYRIFAHNDDGEYDPSLFQMIRVSYDSPLRPPDEIHTEVEDKLVFLKWATPDRLVDGRPGEDLIGYNIYRREPGGDWVKINGAKPWPETYYEDARVANERVYEYKIRSIRMWMETIIEGPSSPVASAKPVDLTPPAPPVKVYSASTGAGVKLTWPEVTEPDLAGYNVYRKREDESSFKKITPKPLADVHYTDGEVQQGRTYFYRVTSVDNSPAANESEPSPMTRVRFEP